jgi:hypothetical protein
MQVAVSEAMLRPNKKAEPAGSAFLKSMARVDQ